MDYSKLPPSYIRFDELLMEQLDEVEYCSSSDVEEILKFCENDDTLFKELFDDIVTAKEDESPSVYDYYPKCDDKYQISILAASTLPENNRNSPNIIDPSNQPSTSGLSKPVKMEKLRSALIKQPKQVVQRIMAAKRRRDEYENDQGPSGISTASRDVPMDCSDDEEEVISYTPCKRARF